MKKTKNKQPGAASSPASRPARVRVGANKEGFTLVELLVVIAIIGLLSSIILVAVSKARQTAKQATAVANIKEMQKALEIYITDVGFYPPDVNRGWDPGLAKALPYDTTGSGQDCATNMASCICGTYLSCTAGGPPPGLTNTWTTSAQNNWRGPYIIKWPQSTPWGGVYDYNYWPTATTRGPLNNCVVPPGIYLGIESGTGFTLDAATEQMLYNAGIDNDGCPDDGEAQLLLMPL